MTGVEPRATDPPPPDAAAPPAAAAAPQGRWSGEPPAWALSLAGDWRGLRTALPLPPPALLAPQPQGRLTLEAHALGSWDAGLASALWQRLAPLDRRALTLDLQGLPAGLREILTLALPAVPVAVAAPPHAATANALASQPHQGLAASWRAARQQAAHTLAGPITTLGFIGQTMLSLARLIPIGHTGPGRSALRATDLAWQLEQTGPRSLPIIALVSFLVGLIVAYMGAAQLQRFGAQAYIADLVTIGVVREVAALVVGIVLAGRVGAAFAAQLASMGANEETDALRTLGVDPVDHLVLPRVLALLLVGPLLTAFAALVGMLAGALVAVGIYGITPLEYLVSTGQALTLQHVLIGLFKGTVYALLVALAGCRQGLSAGRSAQAVGEATTAAVVQAIVWIVVAASVLTIIFQRLDL